MAWMARRGTLVLIVVIGLLLPALAALQYRWMGEISHLEQVRAKTNIDAAAQRFSTEFDEMLAAVYSQYHGQLPSARGGGHEADVVASRAARPPLAKQVLVISRDGRGGFTVRELDAGGAAGGGDAVAGVARSAADRHRRPAARTRRCRAGCSARCSTRCRRWWCGAARRTTSGSSSCSICRTSSTTSCRRCWPAASKAGSRSTTTCSSTARTCRSTCSTSRGPNLAPEDVRRLGQPDAAVRHPQPRSRPGDGPGADARRRRAPLAASSSSRRTARSKPRSPPPGGATCGSAPACWRCWRSASGCWWRRSTGCNARRRSRSSWSRASRTSCGRRCRPSPAPARTWPTTSSPPPTRPGNYGRIIQQEGRRLHKTISDILLCCRLQTRAEAVLNLRPTRIADVIDRAVEDSRVVVAAAGRTRRVRTSTRGCRWSWPTPTRCGRRSRTWSSTPSSTGGTARCGSPPAPSARARSSSRSRTTAPASPRTSCRASSTPFYRGKRARDTQVDGSGIGLNVVYQVVRSHGGRIRVSRAEPQGTRFTVQVPGLPLGALPAPEPAA